MRGSGKRKRSFTTAVRDQPTAAAWSKHDHTADAVCDEARKPVIVAGSIEVARAALEHKVEPLSGHQRHELAKRLGYDSFESLLEVSTVMTLKDGSSWCLTRDRFGTWAAWNVCTVEVPRRFETKDQAVAAIRKEKKAT